jgi:hypothetical protein
LTQDEGSSQKDCRHHSKFQLKVDTSSQRGGDHFGSGLTDRPCYEVEQHISEPPAHTEGNGHTYQAVNKAFAQFLEVVEERHLPG